MKRFSASSVLSAPLVLLVAFAAIVLFFLGLTTIDKISAYHARLYFVPEKASVALDGEVYVDVKIDAEEAFVNAAEASIVFPADMLHFVAADTTGSVISFWIEKPSESGEGVIRFSGGTPEGVTGVNLQVTRLKFRAVGAGVADIRVTDAAVTAADGKGTNVLSHLEATAIRIGGTAIAVPPAPPEEAAPAFAPAAAPAAAPSHLPSKPVVTVPLYPDGEVWHGQKGELRAFWEVPDDVIRVATAFDKDPHTEPKTAEKSVATEKNFGIQGDGVFYIHVQFKNAQGWGPVAHRRVAIDATPPLPFDIYMDDAVTDNPAPVVQFHGHDELSGISHAVVIVDGKDPFTVSGPTELPPQLPGIHTVNVRLFDYAGNSAESTFEFEILPLQTPSVGLFAGCLCQDEPFIVSGTAVPNVFVDLVVLNKRGAALHRQSAESDTSGNWKIAIDEAFPVGKYTFTVIARDERGARSLSTPPQPVTVRSRPLLAVGSFQIRWSHIILAFLGLVALGRVVFVSYTSGWIKDIRKIGHR